MAFTEGRLGSWIRKWQKSNSAKNSGTPTSWPRSDRNTNNYHNIDGYSSAQIGGMEAPISKDFRTPYHYGPDRGDEDMIYLTDYKGGVNGALRGSNGSNFAN